MPDRKLTRGGSGEAVLVAARREAGEQREGAKREDDEIALKPQARCQILRQHSAVSSSAEVPQLDRRERRKAKRECEEARVPRTEVDERGIELGARIAKIL